MRTADKLFFSEPTVEPTALHTVIYSIQLHLFLILPFLLPRPILIYHRLHLHKQPNQAFVFSSIRG
jgi:hypothetical protein